MRTEAVSALRQRMIEDINSRKLCAGTQRGHIRSCKRFAAFLKRSPDTATLEDIRLFQLHLSEAGVSICNRNRIMTGLRFLFRVTLRRLDLAAEIYHIREPQKIPLAPAAPSVPHTPRFRALALFGCWPPQRVDGLGIPARLRLRSCIIDGEAVACNDGGIAQFNPSATGDTRQHRVPLCVRPDRAERRRPAPRPRGAQGHADLIRGGPGWPLPRRGIHKKPISFHHFDPSRTSPKQNGGCH